MNLSVGIVGLPNVGKSTLFQALTKQSVNIANYPFSTIDPNVGVVAVPDQRPQQLFRLSKTKKIVPAVIEFFDIAGLVKNAHLGQGLGNQFLSYIREVSVILQVVRCFKNRSIVHIESEVNPIRDIEIVNSELIFKDLEALAKAIERVSHKARAGDRQSIKELEILEKAKEVLDKGELLNTKEDLAGEQAIKDLQLLTIKPQLYLLNGKPEDVSDDLIRKIKALRSDYLIFDLSQDADLPESLGISSKENQGSSLDILIRKCYDLLGLITFFTITGTEETRVWAIKKGTKAPQAAGVIHSDFEKKFIRLEVINWEKLLEAGSWLKAKEKGWVRSEGKEYELQEGDVVIVRHGP